PRKGGGLVEKSEKIRVRGMGPRYSPKKITRLAGKGFFQHLVTSPLFRAYAQRKGLKKLFQPLKLSHSMIILAN
ncbi:MAG: hypothetical protein ACUVQG_09100, partial [Thermogutta sp.]